jgi:large subunit ribosomal protein L19e
MKTLKLQRKLASRILRCGENKIWIDPERLEDVKEAITSEDIRQLIREKSIKRIKSAGIKARAGKKRRKRKKKGRKRGVGKIKKRINKRKQRYVKKVRKLRNYLKLLKKQNKINTKQANKIKNLIKAGEINTIKNIEEYIK